MAIDEAPSAPSANASAAHKIVLEKGRGPGGLALAALATTAVSAVSGARSRTGCDYKAWGSELAIGSATGEGCTGKQDYSLRLVGRFAVGYTIKVRDLQRWP